VNGARVYNEIKNLSVFEAYERNFWPDVNFFGDINEDYLVNASDALVILQVVVGKAEINYTQWAAGDVDANGQLNAKDALHVLQYAVNLIDWFPAEAELYGILI
ncbi:MAG: dockerin type I repeat-containing protein, partial [Clostridia bacterium]|nr:dockerin type I repeat-containing protein [Clostridia bacterium]